MSNKLASKYETERAKRQNASKGLAQFLDKAKSASYILSDVDPWIDAGTLIRHPVPPGGHCKIIIFGAGFAGVLSAIKCLETGAAKTPNDILIVDPAGGFGGTWYWNRYPGLMCDVESYTYLPLLEETGYVPTRRFPGGEEIRKYIDILTKHYNIQDRALFQSRGKNITWDSNHWICEIIEHPKGGPEQTITLTADYAVLASGGFTYPKMPNTSGLDKFEGQMMHTGRWRYNITGGTAANPVLDKLRDKKVAIVGTGATAIQAVPELAKYAQELYVFQRTPSAVDARGDRETIQDEWRTKIANKKGWQAERLKNLQAYTEQSENLPGQLDEYDGFQSMSSIRMAFGGPSNIKAENVSEHLALLQAIDDARSDKIRARTLEIVKDKETAEKLQAWYPGWCKRPTFHDAYLQSFNRPNVHLVDTDGQGLEGLTPKGILANGREYPVDIIVWSTGYGNPLTESLAGKAEMIVQGTKDTDLEGLNKSFNLTTLHGCMSAGFPNLFMTALSQAGVGVNQVQRLAEQALHHAYIIAEAERRVGDGKKAVIEPTEDACNAWADEIASAAHLTAGMLTCTPGYFSLEGDLANIPQDLLPKLGRSGLYGQGYMKYANTLENWRQEGNMAGLRVTSV